MTPKQAKQRGRKGGRAKSEKKAASSAENGKLGGRPAIQDEFSDRHDLSRAMKSYWRKKAQG
jgi:hypothetical protein